MSKLTIFLFSLFLIGVFCENENPRVPTPATINAGQAITFNHVFPQVDKYLRQTYWYYLRAANIVYQSNVNLNKSFLFFVIYRNVVGTFLVISTWDKSAQTTQVNTFVRLGNGYAEGSGALYDPIKIEPFVISLQLGEGQYIVTINEDGTITVIGDQSNGNETPEFDIESDMEAKCGIVDSSVRQKYWYYLRDAELVHASRNPTSQRYYCVHVYVNIVGTFLVIGNWELQTEVSGVNTFVRLGNGSNGGSGTNGPVTYEPIVLSPAVLEMQNFGN